jgi:hypothetical protein
MATNSLPTLRPYLEAFYPLGGKKQLPRELLENLGGLGLAIWWQDDGSPKCGNRPPQLHTEGFSESDVRWLADDFFPRQFGLRFYPRERVGPLRTPGTFLLELSHPYLGIMRHLLRPFTEASMLYKLNMAEV